MKFIDFFSLFCLSMHMQQTSSYLNSVCSTRISTRLHAGAPLNRRKYLHSTLTLPLTLSLSLSYDVSNSANANANALSLPLSLSPPPLSYSPARRSTAYIVNPTLPPTLNQLPAMREASKLKSLSKDNTVVLLGSHFSSHYTAQRQQQRFQQQQQQQQQQQDKDAALLLSIIKDILKPRKNKHNANANALAIKFLPTASQPLLTSFLLDPTISPTALSNQLVSEHLTPLFTASDVTSLIPIFTFCRTSGTKLLATSPPFEAIDRVRMSGLSALSPSERDAFFVDPAGFANMITKPVEVEKSAGEPTLSENDLRRKKFRLYADYVMTRDFKPANENDRVSNFFAERCMVDEVVATNVAQFLTGEEANGKGLVLLLDSICNVEYGAAGGVESRLQRIVDATSKQEKGKGKGKGKGKVSTASFLINPTARDTLSLGSSQLRLSIGTKPELFDVETKVCDFIWFSDVPKINLLNRVMND